jgi:uncharacterized protein (TIGR00255 family)
MTGFGFARRSISEGEIEFSVKSVNHRGLDIQFHMPPEFDGLESEIRSIVKTHVARGHLQVRVTFARTSVVPAAPFNRPMLDAYILAFREAAAHYHVAGEPDLNAALSMPGMLNAGSDRVISESVAGAVLEAACEAIAAMNGLREREGAAMACEIRQRSEAIRGLTARMEEIRARAVPAFQNRLRDRLADLLDGAGLEPQRLAQEAALLADRSDISEELVRLRTHAGQLDQMLAGEGEAGKRLDFLLQEMNRETNTILAKTGGLGDLGLTMTELGLAAKSEIDKIREQSLNLE